MPIYNYRCGTCKGEFSQIEPHYVLNSELDCKATEHCNGKAVRKPSRTSFSLKGSGWYKDGY